MTTTQDVVPLPDSLSKCGCRFAPSRHATTCTTAIEFDAIDLRDRPEYELGRRFAAISWDFPLRISATVRIEVELDPIAVIVAHADEYEQFELERGYEAWEKPMVWLSQRIEEQSDFGVWFGSRRLSHDSSHFDEVSEYPRWTPADTDRLNEALAKPAAPDPNQGALEV